MLITYRVVIYLRAHEREQVLAAIEAAFGSVTAGNAKIYEVDPSAPPKRET